MARRKYVSNLNKGYSGSYAVLYGEFIVELMENRQVISADETIYPSMKAARIAAVKMLTASENENAYVRIHKLSDASIYDMLTKARMKTRNYNGYDENDQERHARMEARQYDDNGKRKPGNYVNRDCGRRYKRKGAD